MNQSEAVIAFSTIDSEEEAKKIACALVEAKLAACVNIVPKLTSIYQWKEKLCEEEEFLLIIKTSQARFEELKTMFTELHPYEVPELIACPIIDGLPDYLDWVIKSTQ